MLIVLALANSLVDEPPLLRARFDLAAVQAPAPIATVPIKSRFRLHEPTLDTAPDGDGIQVKLRWKRIRVRMPIPSL